MPALRDLVRYIKKAWVAAKAIEEETFLFAYEKQYEANKEKRKALNIFHRIKKPRHGARKPSPMVVSWAEFTQKVRADGNHRIEERLSVLRRRSPFFSGEVEFCSNGSR